MTATPPDGPWVVVVGCHRSGTSAVAGALVSLGLHGVDPVDRMDDPTSNPEHWESLASALWDEELLGTMGGSWEAPPDPGVPVPDPDDAPDGTGPRDFLARAYPEPGPVVWKDPRVCLLLPYWRAVLPAPIAAVFVWREPLAVARSLQSRNGIPLEDGLALWETYNRTAALGLRGVDTFVLNYSDLMRRPAECLTPLADWLAGLPGFAPWSGGWDPARAVASLDEGLHHQSGRARPVGEGSLPDEHAVAEWLRSVDGPHTPFTASPPDATSPWIEAVIRGRRERFPLRRQLEDTAEELKVLRIVHDGTLQELDGARQALDGAEQALAGARAALEGSRQQTEDARREIEQLLASTSWRVTRPLRSVLSRLAR